MPAPLQNETAARFIVLEGIDGAGTTTQLERLAAHFGPRLHVTREPTTGPIGREIRRHLAGPVDGVSLDPAALALLFAADRIDHWHREIGPQLARGVHVVTDRYLTSSLAYQTLGVERDVVASFNRFARPADLTIYIDAPVEIAEQRRAARGGPSEIFEQRALQERIRGAYLAEIRRLRDTGAALVEIDGTAGIEDVFARVLDAVQSCIAATVGSK